MRPGEGESRLETHKAGQLRKTIKGRRQESYRIPPDTIRQGLTNSGPIVPQQGRGNGAGRHMSTNAGTTLIEVVKACVLWFVGNDHPRET